MERGQASARRIAVILNAPRSSRQFAPGYAEQRPDKNDVCQHFSLKSTRKRSNDIPQKQVE